MFPSKAERIFSRYRPIAPSPLPLPPSGSSFGTTDPSSTCASLDSFTSSAKCKKPRKRRTNDPTSSAKVPKTPKPVVSGISTTGGASSVTQGASDGTVPPGCLHPTSQVSHGSRPFVVDEVREMSNGTSRDVMAPPDLCVAAYNCKVVSPLARDLSTGNAKDIMDVQVTAFNSGFVSPLIKELSNGNTKDVTAMTGMRVVANNGIVPTLHMVDADIMPQQHQGDTSLHHQHQFSLLPQRISPVYSASSAGNLIEKDVAFMERAAAATATAYTERNSFLGCDVKGAGYAGGGFTEMIRGITRLPTAADVQSLMQARASSSAAAVGAVVPSGNNAGTRSPPTLSREVHQRRSDHCCEPDPLSHVVMEKPPLLADRSNDGELVTLPLLPDVPSKICSSCEAPSSTRSSSAHSPFHRLSKELSWHLQTSSRLESMESVPSRGLRACPPMQPGVPLFQPIANKPLDWPISPAVGVSPAPRMVDGAVIDEVYLEQVYGGSTDPVLLVDDCNQVLWFNKPYERALKSVSERLAGKTAPTGPYIDPLGHPTPLGSITLPVYCKPMKVTKATLWGFLKKLVTQESETSPLEPPGPSSLLKLSIGESCQRSPSCVEAVSSMGAAMYAGNFRPTVVTLERITELHMEAPAAAECMEAVEARLEAGNEPALITDCLNRVRWANGALKQMVGHVNHEISSARPEASSSGVPNASMSVPSDALAFVVSYAEKVPRSAWAFSGRVNLEWMKGNKRRSMIVPCDVSRLACSSRSTEMNWVWKFDMAVSLCLNSHA